MTTQIDNNIPQPPAPKRGRPRKRAVPKLAADAIRAEQFDSIHAAARAFYFDHYSHHEVIDDDCLKDLKRYIVEELESAPKSMHVYSVLSAHLIKQLQQPKAKEERRREIIKLLKGA